MESKREDARKFFRVKHPIPLCASMALKAVNGKEVQTGSINVCILNISPEGLCFWSGLKLPVGFAAIFEFKMKILGETRAFHGRVVRKKVLNEDFTEYGLKFSEEHSGEDAMIQIVNNWSIALRKQRISVLNHTCNFCRKNPKVCLMNK